MNWTNNRSFAFAQDDSREGEKHILALAPLADHTDSPFCCTCRKVESQKFVKLKVNNTPSTHTKSRIPFLRRVREVFGQPLLTSPWKGEGNKFVIFREMVSAEAIVRGNEKTLKMCKFKNVERPIVIQIFGSNPKTMAKATEIIVKKFKPDGIDINMGCPVPKVAGKAESGAFLMKDQERAVEIVKAVKKVLGSYLPRKLGRSKICSIPLSVKTRLGWSNKTDILEFAPKLEKAGADLITIHGRTKTQGYSGKSDWKMIGRAKKKVKIPVLANGDITSENFKECLKITGADGVMIGRGALGNPWIFNNVRNTKSYEITKKERIKTILYHAKLHEKQYGNLVSFRKHLMWYFKGDRINIPNLKKLRQQLVKVENLKELERILKEKEN